jgi:hypothetical protein
MTGYCKTDSGLFIIYSYGNMFFFPMDNEYLEMMAADDLFFHYVDRVKKYLSESDFTSE